MRRNEELKGSNLQSPHDSKATYRRKGKKDTSKGYTTNISETCHEENKVQLITKVSTDCNVKDDSELYAEDVEDINERMELDEVTTDGRFVGKKAREASKKHNIEHKVTETRGSKPSSDKLSLDDFEVIRGKQKGGEREGEEYKEQERGEQKESKQKEIVALKCPTGNTAVVETGQVEGRHIVRFRGCEGCPLSERCPTVLLKRENVRVLRFTDEEVGASEMRKEMKKDRKKLISRRASVESTVRSVIHPFGGHLCKMPVRGRFRVNYMLVLSAAMVNIRRIYRYNREIMDNGGCFFNDFLKTQVTIVVICLMLDFSWLTSEYLENT